MKNNYGFFFLLLTLTVFCQGVKGQETEKLEQWIFPAKNNFLSLKSKTNSEDFFRINYFKISNQLVGTTLEIGFMNSDPSAKLFEIGNDEISLIRTKDGAFGDMGGEEHDFGKNNIYFKLPTPMGTTKWSYADYGGTIYYGQCYWKTGKEKLLVIERQMSGRQQFPEKTVEYYSKDGGLVKQENFNIKTSKITESYAVEESGFDSETNIQDFPLFGYLESIEKDKSSQTKEQSNTANQPQNNISYPDGTIPKEYVVQVFLDKGLPYTVKDTLIIRNKRGVSGIPAPKYFKGEQGVYYDGNTIPHGDWMIDAKIVSISYFKQPFSFVQQLYYSDGEGNLRKVTNPRFYVDIDYKLNNTSTSKDFVMRDTLDKCSDLYKELSPKMQKQGIYLVVNKTSEENVKSQKIVRINFEEE
ncbi:hypothetical protein [Chryseobacterium viscerum]|uniref:Uncharacterized protein n=1 Tax=Chryseobacterium viscerum TaxID=1037377 RepID=A0A316WVM6_9FLAO|nr:hypothetical protein [Chryseobacterium viscerum]PWN65297.1 hypothetical protein C1634_000700 [Chryseobacterium viscerum]